ncbi:hypothetical protein Tco_0307832 [Tanacetum coccineum]
MRKQIVDFVDEEGDPIPNNIGGCIWMLNNYVKNITKERKGFEKMLTAAEHMFPGNINLIGFADKYINSLKCTSGGLNDVGFGAQRNEEVEVGVSDIGVNEQTPGFGKDLMGLTKNSFADVVVDTKSLFRFDRQENMVWVLTQQAFESVADEVERSIENSKIMETDDIPSFSFGVTQDFDVIPVTNNEKKSLNTNADKCLYSGGRSYRVADVDATLSSEEIKVTKYLFMTNHESDTHILFKSISGQQSNRLQMESLGQDYVETNILDTWAVDKDSFSQMRNDDGRFERVARHVKSVTRARSELNKLKKIDLVFLSVDNEGHRFLLTFDLKYGAVTVFDQKKKDKILKKANLRKEPRLATHADFGRYLYGLDHIKSRNMITDELEIGGMIGKRPRSDRMQVFFNANNGNIHGEGNAELGSET